MRGGFKFVLVALMAILPAVVCAENSTRHTSKPGSGNSPAQSAPQTPQTLEQSAIIPARVTFQNGQLSIIARNSTLGDILRQVQKLTGAEIEQPGSANERVVGTFGPGPARDVLSDLLYGSHYNYVVLGSDSDPHAVAKIMLFPKTVTADSAPAETAAAYQGNSVAPQPMPQRPFPGRPGMPVPMAAQQQPPATEDADAQSDDDNSTDDSSDDQADNADDQSNDNTAQAQGEEATDQNQQVRSPEQMLQELQQQQQQQQQQNPNQPLMRPGFPPGMQPGMPPGAYPPGMQQPQQQQQ
jgi:hypothetical protein